MNAKQFQDLVKLAENTGITFMFDSTCDGKVHIEWGNCKLLADPKDVPAAVEAMTKLDGLGLEAA